MDRDIWLPLLWFSIPIAVVIVVGSVLVSADANSEREACSQLQWFQTPCYVEGDLYWNQPTCFCEGASS